MIFCRVLATFEKNKNEKNRISGKNVFFHKKLIIFTKIPKTIKNHLSKYHEN